MFKSAGFTFEQPYSVPRYNERIIDRNFLKGIKDTTFDSALRMIKDDDPVVFMEVVQRVEDEVERAEKSDSYRTYFSDRVKIFWGIKR